MPIKSLSHYNFRAERALMEKLRDFYIEVVALQVGPRPSFLVAGYWLYAEDKAVLHLSEEKPNDKRSVGSHLTFDHAAFECSNWTEFEARLIKNGVEFWASRVPDAGQLQVFIP